MSHQDSIHDEVEEVFDDLQEKTLTETEALAQGLRILQPRIPKNVIPFAGLPIKQRAMIILKLAKFTDEEIAILLKVNRKTVAKYTLNVFK